MMLYDLFILISSCATTLLFIPAVIHVAKARQLYDDPKDLLKSHVHLIPRLGGVAIFLSFTIHILLWIPDPGSSVLPINALLAAAILLFALGLKDDLTGVSYQTKFSLQFIAGVILTIPGNIRLANLQGLFGIYELPYSVSIVLSIFIQLFIINAFNLIDGIDGLAAGTGIMVHLAFAALFINIQQYELASVSLFLSGALLGFLKFNLSPARIFMGDTGSLLIGLVSAMMGLKFITLNTVSPSTLAIVAAILIVPIADTFQVFIIRLKNRKSPFLGDRNHIHHRLLRLGFTHLQTTAILLVVNGSIILLAFLLFK